ncbi:hypothetical protein [Dactylosporangium sp. NPDC050588]|uniref:hypothetical protein n=1 Tax=Dactylosporangium sp. NPDC050588 TaxID=3157211 RepID=UPI0033C77562
MGAAELNPDDAAQALALVRDRQQQVLAIPPLPGWFWAAVGGLAAGFTAAVESGRPVLVATGAVLFVAGLGAVILGTLRRQPYKVRNRLIGVRGGLRIAAFVVGLVAVGLGLAWVLQDAGVPMPGTVTTVVIAALLAAAGPLLSLRLQDVVRRAADRELDAR